MNRNAAITRARNLIRQRAARISNKPKVFVTETGDVQIKCGAGGLLIRLSKFESLSPYR